MYGSEYWKAMCRELSTPIACCHSTCPSRRSTLTGDSAANVHLDANMVRSALPKVPLREIDLLVIENVGNLVCPAEFRVGRTSG